MQMLHLFRLTFPASWPLLSIAGGASIVALAWER
jgi:hypothetical protein